MTKRCGNGKRWILAVGVAVLAGGAGAAPETTEAPQPGAKPDAVGHWMVAPVFGWNRNELESRDARGQPVTLTDTDAEEGLIAGYVRPRFVVNDILFHTAPNHAEVWGNILTVNVVGPVEKPVTWSAGASHTWHTIEMEAVDITINEPLAKAGVLFRLAGGRVGLNPYLGYAYEIVDTTHGSEEYDNLIYGFAGWTHWRMIQAAVQYYYQDNQDADEGYNVLRARCTVYFNRTVGLLVRGEYIEQVGTTDTSVMAGPVFVF